uniref:Uncharacterized protein n=1 Tax=Anguilla anguilla TaxID=7936 RepID=A0A0E9SLM8_ANGAN
MHSDSSAYAHNTEAEERKKIHLHIANTDFWHHLPKYQSNSPVVRVSPKNTSFDA